MILKGFKENSIKKHLQAILKNPKGTSKAQMVESVGVIVNADEETNLETFKSLTKSLQILPSKLKIVAFSETMNQDLMSWQTCFSADDIGWKGVIKNTELLTFLNTEFDLLISYYKTDILGLKLMTAKSKAHFKTSIFQEDNRLNDLIIQTPLNDFDAFETELLKYLQVFKTLKNET